MESKINLILMIISIFSICCSIGLNIGLGAFFFSFGFLMAILAIIRTLVTIEWE